MRRITADKALRLSKYFGTTPKFWLVYQDDFDFEVEQYQILDELKIKINKTARPQ